MSKSDIVAVQSGLDVSVESTGGQELTGDLRTWQQLLAVPARVSSTDLATQFSSL